MALAAINVEKPHEVQISTYEVPSTPHIHRTYKSFRTIVVWKANLEFHKSSDDFDVSFAYKTTFYD